MLELIPKVAYISDWWRISLSHDRVVGKISLLQMKPLLHVIGQSDHQHTAHCAFSFVDQVIFFDVKHLATSLGKFYSFFVLSKRSFLLYKYEVDFSHCSWIWRV